MIESTQKFYKPDWTPEENATIRQIILKLLRANGETIESAPALFHVKQAGVTAEYVEPDFYLPTRKLYLLLSKGGRLPTRDIQRAAMLNGMYPEFKFQFLSKGHVQQLAAKMITLDEVLATPEPFETNINPEAIE